jgi:hypothetical protein
VGGGAVYEVFGWAERPPLCLYVPEMSNRIIAHGASSSVLSAYIAGSALFFEVRITPIVLTGYVLKYR